MYGAKFHWCDIIILNAHAPIEDETGASRDAFCKELEQVFYQFAKHQINIRRRF
jgi:hypothetical protein